MQNLHACSWLESVKLLFDLGVHIVPPHPVHPGLHLHPLEFVSLLLIFNVLHVAQLFIYFTSLTTGRLNCSCPRQANRLVNLEIAFQRMSFIVEVSLKTASERVGVFNGL